MKRHSLITAIAAVSVMIFTSAALKAEWIPGLLGGYVDEAFNIDGYPAVTNTYSDTEAATNNASPPWADSRTWVYWGQIYLEAGSYYFGENIDDNTHLVLDGEVLIENGGSWGDFVCSKKLTFEAAGWHDIEVRFGNGTGGAGPYGTCANINQTACSEFPCGFGICKGDTAPTGMNDCYYPADNGYGSLFQHDDGKGFANSLLVATSPAGLPAECIPPIGYTNELSDGDTFTCSAALTLVASGLHYKNIGYVLEDMENGCWVNAKTNLDVCSFDFVYTSPTPVRLTWLYESDGFLLDTTQMNAANGGTVTKDPEPMLTFECYTDGTAVQLTANPADGWYFRRWIGDVPEADAHNTTVAVTVDSPKSYRPIFSHGWTYDSVSKTITDGNWTLNVSVGDNNTLTVTDMASVTNQNILDLSTQVVGGDDLSQYTIVSLGNSVFNNKLAGLIHVFLPDTLKNIGGSAFEYLSSLVTVEPFLPDGVTSIGGYAFQYCRSLIGDLTIPSGVTSIGEHAFNECRKIGTLNFAGDENLTTIGGQAFRQCVGITNFVTLPASITSVGGSTFEDCKVSGLDISRTKLTSIPGYFMLRCRFATNEIVIPETVTSIGECAFNECEKISSLNFAGNENLTTIGDWAFRHCFEITNFVTLPASITSAGRCAFEECKVSGLDFSRTKLTSIPDCFMLRCRFATNGIVIPESVTSIGGNAFEGCNNITGDLVIPKSVKTLGEKAFNECSSISSVYFHDGCSKIGNWGFRYCSSITNIYLPKTLVFVGGSMFEKFSAGAQIWWQSCPATIGGYIFYADTPMSITNYVSKTQWTEYDENNDNFTLPATGSECGTWTCETTQCVKYWLPPSDPKLITVLILQ